MVIVVVLTTAFWELREERRGTGETKADIIVAEKVANAAEVGAVVDGGDSEGVGWEREITEISRRKAL